MLLMLRGWQASKLEIYVAQVVYVRCPFSGNFRRVSQAMLGDRKWSLTPRSNIICYHMVSLSASRKLYCVQLVIGRKLPVVFPSAHTRTARNSPYPLAPHQNMMPYLLPTSCSRNDPIYYCWHSSHALGCQHYYSCSLSLVTVA